jgi:cation diffusion facilitator family transporter
VEASLGKQRTALVSIAAATALVLLKLVTGFVTGSVGLIAAGIESSGDVVAAVTTFFAIRVAGKPADEAHQYGHMRFENVAALFEAAVLVAGGAFVVHEAHARLVADGGHALNASWYVFVVLGVAIAIDVSRTLTSLRTARKYRSAALRSNAFHFGADLVGTVAVLVGLGFVAAGYPSADAIVALFVAALIFFAAARLVYENARSLLDTASADATAAIRSAIEGLEPAVELRRLRIREAAGAIFADVVIGVPATAALAEGHTLADRAHNVTVLDLAPGRHVALHLKLPPELPLAEARSVAAEVEAAIRARVPAVGIVQTHLEPLERPVSARPTRADAGQRIDEAVATAVSEYGATLRSSCSFEVDGEFVTFVTVKTSGAVDVAAAHGLASGIEQHVHRGVPDVRDLVVQVEPGP